MSREVNDAAFLRASVTKRVALIWGLGALLLGVIVGAAATISTQSSGEDHNRQASRETIVSTVTVSSSPPAAANTSVRTVDQIVATDGPTDWLKRLQRAGLGDWPLVTMNDWAWDICEQLWVGGDYELIIVNMSIGVPRDVIERVYSAAVGSTCDPPLGAPPGLP